MAYLTFDEYAAFDTTLVADDFNKVIGQAEANVDDATRDYYQLHSLGDDPNQRRVRDFKRAIAEQADYLHFVGASKSYEQASDDFKSISIGRLNLTTNQTAMGTTRGGLCRETYQLLGKHGLLWRGV